MPSEAQAPPILILAPIGRDASVVAGMVQRAGITAVAVEDFNPINARLEASAGLIVAAEAFERLDPRPLYHFLQTQPPWSDYPVVFLRTRDAPVSPDTQAFVERLGNVTVLERPLHPITLVSAARSAVRARQRQRQSEAVLREREEVARSLRASEERSRGLADQLERRVQERTADLNDANRQLVSEMVERERVEATMMRMQRLEAVGQLTAGVAHDFNNLLTVVLGNLTWLEKNCSNESRRRIDMMRMASERGAKLTSQLLAFSRRARLEPKAINLNDAVSSLKDLLQSTLGASAALRTQLETNPWLAQVDPTQIEMVILNLAINARDAMPSGGVIRVETSNVTIDTPRSRPEEPEAGDYVLLSVRDDGSGMDEATVLRAFEPFFTTKDVGRGSGLGLSQVLGFAKQSGGGVRIETELGRGTAVHVYLPRAAAAPGATLARPSLVLDGLRAGAEGGVVLLVDDDEAVRLTTAGMLDDLGFKVIEAGSGVEALSILATPRQVDLLLLDFAMPGMNGADVARAATVRRPGLPILFVTGYADVAALTSIGEHRVIRKPFEEHELAERLARALDDSADEASAP